MPDATSNATLEPTPDPQRQRLSVRPHDLVTAAFPLVLALLGLYVILRLVHISSSFLVLVCASALMALALNRIAVGIEKRVGVPRRWAATGLLLLLLVGAVTATYLAGARVVTEFADLGQELPRAADGLRDSLLAGPLGSYLEPALTQPNGGFQPSQAFGSMTTWFSSIAGALSSLFFFVAVTLYLCVQPELYVKGFLKLLKTPERQSRAREVLDKLYDRLWNFLLAAFCEMTLVGVMTGLGLWALGINYALALAITAGLLCFIPVVGPALSFLPALLVGLSMGSDEAIKVTALFAGIQLVESNLVTPLIQERLADIPPVLLLFAQAVAGVVFGFVGIALAAPSVVVLMVLVEEFHLRPDPTPPSEIPVAAVEPSLEPSRGGSQRGLAGGAV